MRLQLKSVFILVCFNLFLTSCASINEPIVKKTIYTDIGPENLSRSQYYEHLGQDYFLHRDFENSIEMFRLSILHDPNNQTALFSLAQSYVNNKQNHLAMIELEKYFLHRSSYTGVTDQDMQLVSEIYERSNSFLRLIELQQDYFKKTGSTWALWKIYENQMHLKNWPDAMVTLKNLENLKQDPYKVHFARADVLEQQNKFTEALESLVLAENNKPFDQFVMRKKIQVLFDLKNWSAVSAEGAKYSKYHPYDIDISERWAYSAIQVQDYDTALSELQKQKKVYPDSIGLDFKIAHVLFLTKDYVTAKKMYEDIYELTESDESVFYLAQIYIIRNQLSKATDQIELLPPTSEYFASAQIQIARLEWKNNDKDRALNRMRTAHNKRQDSFDLYQEYAQYLIWTKNYVESIAFLEKSGQYFPKSDKLFLLSAYSHFKLNNQRKFNADIKSAIALGPKNAEIYAVLSELWYEKRKPATEIQYLAEKAIALNSENKNVKPLLAWALLQQDQLTKAVALFEEFYDKNPNEIFYAQSLAEIYVRNSLPIKTENYQEKVAELILENKLKNEIDFFSKQNQIYKTNSEKIQTRLPAGLDQ